MAIADDVLAVILGTIANSIYNIGLVLKKKGACTLPDIEEQTAWQNIKNFTRCKTWVLGFSLTIAQWFILMAAYRFGTFSLVASTMAIGLVVLIIFSKLFLKERIRLAEIIGIIAIIAATVSLNLVGQTISGKLTLIEVNQLYREPNAIAFMCCYAVIIAILIFISYGRKFRAAGALLAIASGAGYAMATIFAKGAVGTLDFSGGLAFLESSLKAWQWWIYLVLMCLGYFTAFTSQQMALQKGKAIVVSPTLDEINLFTQVIAGIVIFNDWTNAGLLPWEKTVKTISIIVIMLGVALLSFYTSIEEAIKNGMQKEEEKLDKEEELEEEELVSEPISEVKIGKKEPLDTDQIQSLPTQN